MEGKSPVSSKETVSPVGRKRRHRYWVVAVLVIVLTVLLVSFAPQLVVRYLVAHQLEEWGIEHEGIETIRIGPWAGELWLGPVRFGSSNSERGQVADLGVRLGFRPLFNRRLSVERFLVQGIDVVLRRDDQDGFSLNGIPLTSWLAASSPETSPVDDELGWLAGVDTLELRNSRLIFENPQGGSLDIHVEQFTLFDLRSWTADEPSRFELKAQVNDIQLQWRGEATPLADNISLEIDSLTRHAEVPKVLQFTGPMGLGLERQRGVYDADLKYRMTLSENGRLEGNTRGTIDIRDADYRREAGLELAFQSAALRLDIAFQSEESGKINLQGEIELGIEDGKASMPDIRFGSKESHVLITDLEAGYQSDGETRLFFKPEIKLRQLEFSGPIEISLGTVVEVLAALQSLSVPGDVAVADTGLENFSGNSLSVPRSTLKVKDLETGRGAFSLQSSAGRVVLGVDSYTDLQAVQLGVGERQISMDRLRSRLQDLKLDAGQGKLDLQLNFQSDQSAITSRSPLGELRAKSLNTALDGMALRAGADAVSLRLEKINQELAGFAVTIHPEGRRPELQVGLAGANSTLGPVVLKTVAGDPSWKLNARAALDTLSAAFAKGEQGALKIGRAEINGLQLNQDMEIAADALGIHGLDVYFKRSMLEALQNDPSPIGVAKNNAAAGAVKAQNRGPASGASDVGRVQQLLTLLGFPSGPIDGKMGPRTAAAIRAFQRQEGIHADGKVTAELLAVLESRGGETSRPELSRSSPHPKVQLGEVALTGNSVIRFRDDLVKPEVNVDAVFREARIRNVNTRKTQQPTQVRLASDINEFTHVDISGWVGGVNTQADLDLKLKVDNVELSTFSPYIEELAGVHLESGQLDSSVTGKASAGTLQGEIKIDLEGITFAALSKENAERVEGALGVPLETAVGLLQDDKGHINLALPLGGTLEAPKVDLSSAVGRAVGGALKRVFPPSMAISLLSGVVEGSTPTLEPITFAPGSAQLDDESERYIDQIAVLLGEHPKLRLRVCGRSTAKDRNKPASTSDSAAAAVSDKEAQTLSELAIARKRTVRRYLIQKKGATGKQVAECRSTFDPADQESPRVEISL